MTSLELLQEIDAWLSFNNSPSKEQISKLRKDIKKNISEQLNILLVSNNEVTVCNSNSATWNADLGLMICDECGYSHPLQTDC